ncbi:MAG: hypothetical protein MUC67_10000, partial [Acidobacteria bacterium]|nr:hypothetical protein [Acidobacteriota bacterium]
MSGELTRDELLGYVGTWSAVARRAVRLGPLGDRRPARDRARAAAHDPRLLRLPARAVWAEAFDARVAERIEQRDDDAVIDWRALGPGAALAVPTAEHYLPLL